MGYSFAKTSFDKTSFAKTYTRLVRLNRRMSTATSPREAIKRHTDALIHSSPHHFAELTSKLDGFADRGVMRHLQNLKLKPIGNMWGAEARCDSLILSGRPPILQCAPIFPLTRNDGVLVQYSLVQVADMIARLHTKTSTLQIVGQHSYIFWKHREWTGL